MDLVVVTYNVHRCLGRDGRHDPDRIAGVLHEIAADLVGLQEVSARPPAGGGIDQLDHLARAMGLYAVAGPTLRLHRGQCGNGLLSRWPIRDVRRLDLTVPGREPRGAIDADLDLEGRPLRCLVTHLGLRGGERRQQLRRLLPALAQAVEVPTVLLGDLNEWFEPARRLRRLLGDFASVAVRTFPAGRPVLALDRIIVRPPSALGLVAAHATPLARVASDHLPLRGVIRLGEHGPSTTGGPRSAPADDPGP
jgi:endonuclease/exonuclease/phosphatase family metal-dependent hydrolase